MAFASKKDSLLLSGMRHAWLLAPKVVGPVSGGLKVWPKLYLGTKRRGGVVIGKIPGYETQFIILIPYLVFEE